MRSGSITEKRNALKSLFPKPKKKGKNESSELTGANALTSTSLVTLKPRKTEDDEIGELALEFEERLRSMDNWFDTNVAKIKRKHELYRVEHNLKGIKEKAVEPLQSPVSSSSLLPSAKIRETRAKYSVINVEVITLSPDNKSVENGEYASVCISLIGANSLLQGKTPLDVDWASVVFRGSDLYAYWKTNIATEHQGVNPSTQEIITLFEPDCSFTVGKEIRGTLDESLRDAISTLQREKLGVAIVNIHHYCFCVYHEHNDHNTDLWMFDSHGGHENGKSSLIKFYTGIDLSKYIMEKHQNQSQSFEFVILLKK